MADVIARTFVGLSGWTGSPGVNVIHWSPRMTFPADVGDYTPALAAGFLADLRAAYLSVANRFVQGTRITFPADVALIESTTGTLVGAVTATTAPADIVSTGSPGKTSRSTQATLALLTSDYLSGRRIQGRIFLGPLGTDALNDSGLVNDDFASAVVPAFADVVEGGTSDGVLTVWHRPKAPSRAGKGCPVTALAIRRLPGVLRSRRD